LVILALVMATVSLAVALATAQATLRSKRDISETLVQALSDLASALPAPNVQNPNGTPEFQEALDSLESEAGVLGNSDPGEELKATLLSEQDEYYLEQEWIDEGKAVEYQ
jgi:hypothetical protein